MTPEPTCTLPSAHVTAAREAVARLETHLGAAIGPTDASTDFATLLFASTMLEAADAPYPPLDPSTHNSLDPQADLTAAIEALTAASKEAGTARETLRLADVAHTLRELVGSPRLTAPNTDRGERA